MTIEQRFIKKAAYLLEHSLVGKPPASVSSAHDYALALEQMIVTHCEVIAANPNLSNKTRAELVKFNRLAKELLGGLLGGHLKDMPKLETIKIGEKVMFKKFLTSLFRPSVKEISGTSSAFEDAMKLARDEQARLAQDENRLKGELEALQAEVNAANRRRADIAASAKQLDAARKRIASLEASIRVMETAAEKAAKDEADDLVIFLSVIQGVEAPQPAPVVAQEAPLPLSVVLQQPTTNQQKSIINQQPSTTNQPSTINQQPTIINLQPPTNNNQQIEVEVDEVDEVEEVEEVEEIEDGIPAPSGGVCPSPVIVGIKGKGKGKGKAMDKSTGPNPKKVGEVGDAFADIANIEAS